MKINCAFVFPGQGSQAPGMGESFYKNSKIVRDLFEQAKERTGIDFEKLMFTDNSDLDKTEFSQPAIVLNCLSACAIMKDQLVLKPKYVLGHSLGEVTALACTGAIDTIDAIELVHKRGLLMAKACEGKDVGMLVVLNLPDEKVEELCQKARDNGAQVWPVNYNTEGQIVVAGIKDDLLKLEQELKDAGARRTIFLNMSVASHCQLLESAVEPFKKELEKVITDNFNAPVISNVTAKPYSSAKETLELLPKQLISPVLYKQSIKAIDDEIDCYIEFGQGNILKGLNRKLTKKPHFNISGIESLEQTIEALKEFM